jgi:hypothetical protein
MFNLNSWISWEVIKKAMKNGRKRKMIVIIILIQKFNFNKEKVNKRMSLFLKNLKCLLY